MCGFVVTVADRRAAQNVEAALDRLAHRGPDDRGSWCNASGRCAMGHRRLSILDLSSAGRQPMSSGDGRYHLVFNGEIYNYLELRQELGGDTEFHTGTDTEVLLAAYQRWGRDCLHRFNGMFAFAVWDEQSGELFACRDRFGVKPLFYHQRPGGCLWLASEIKALHELGLQRAFDQQTWATYLSLGMYDHGRRTFWQDVRSLEPGHWLAWSAKQGLATGCWYDLPEEVKKQGPDSRSVEEVSGELLERLENSTCLRFRADVPVGVCLSGGLDSSLLLGLMHRVGGPRLETKTFTFICGDEQYDEQPWVEQMLEHTLHPAHFCLLSVNEVPELAAKVQASQDEPFGGLPTLGMAKVHARAREEGVTVLLDGNGMDETWAGYDYYQAAASVDISKGPVQASRSPSTRPDCLQPDFAALARPLDYAPPFDEPLLNLQYRDIRYAKIPRAMRFADRVSMMYSRELREPFLDYRLVELAFRQPKDRKIRQGQGKWLPRCIAEKLLPGGVREAPKRPLQTPQREWLQRPLAGWVEECIEAALNGPGATWFDAQRTRAAWRNYREQGADNSFPIWQWVSLGLLSAV